MKQAYKLILITIFSGLFAYSSSLFLQKTSSPAMQAYDSLYQELKQKQDITAAEKKKLEGLFRQINSAKNIKSALTQDLIKHSIFFLILIPTLFFSGRRTQLSKDGSLFASGVIFLTFILSGAVIIGAISGCIFFFASHSARQSPQTSSSD